MTKKKQDYIYLANLSKKNGFSKIYIWAPSLTRINNSYCSGQVSTTITLNDCNMINSEENQNPIAATAQTGFTTV